MIPRRSRRTRRSAWANRTTRRKWRGCWWGCERKSSLSVSPEIVAARQDFFNHGWTRINTHEDGFSLIRVHPCSSVVGSYWLRLRRAALYRRMPSCRTAPWPGRRNTAKDLPICNRRYGRLAICATLNRYWASAHGEGATLEGLDWLFGSGVAPRRAAFPDHYPVG